MKEAKKLFDTIEISNQIKDSHYLNESLFAFYDKNIGIGNILLEKALSQINDGIPGSTQDDWYRSAAILIKLGYANNLLKILSENDFDIILRPFFVAIEALSKNEGVLFFNSIAAEVREPAKKIVAIFKKYIE